MWGDAAFSSAVGRCSEANRVQARGMRPFLTDTPWAFVSVRPISRREVTRQSPCEPLTRADSVPAPVRNLPRAAALRLLSSSSSRSAPVQPQEHLRTEIDQVNKQWLIPRRLRSVILTRFPRAVMLCWTSKQKQGVILHGVCVE